MSAPHGQGFLAVAGEIGASEERHGREWVRLTDKQYEFLAQT